MQKSSSMEMEDLGKVLDNVVDEEAKAVQGQHSISLVPDAISQNISRSLTSLSSQHSSQGSLDTRVASGPLDIDDDDDDPYETFKAIIKRYTSVDDVSRDRESASAPSVRSEDYSYNASDGGKRFYDEIKEINEEDEDTEEKDEEEDEEGEESSGMYKPKRGGFRGGRGGGQHNYLPAVRYGNNNNGAHDRTRVPQPDYGLPNGPTTLPKPPNLGHSIKADYVSEPSDPVPDYGASLRGDPPSDYTPHTSNALPSSPNVGRSFQPKGGVQIFPGNGNINIASSIRPTADNNGNVKSQKVETSEVHPVRPRRRSDPFRGAGGNSVRKDAVPPELENDPLMLSDLAKLPELTLDTITNCIEERYRHDLIYTRCGEILISVNPFKVLELCSSKYHEGYTYTSISPRPHLFSISAKAYRGVRNLEQDQVILVSGESGAGKTEATKLMVQHLMAIGGSEYDFLQEKIVMVNPLLEVFGNAQTKLNNNSSRFAKFLSLSINKSGKIESARIKDYMLEKSRVVHHNSREKTFHSFYALLEGASQSELESLYINPTDQFRITGSTSLTSEEKKRYKHLYEEQQNVFRLIDLQPEEIMDIKTILAAILHIGNIQFEDWEHDSVLIKDETWVEKAALLLHLDVQQLTKVLIERRGKMGKATTGREIIPTIAMTPAKRREIIELSKNKKQAEDERDAVAKSLYERLFGWLVRKINDSLRSSVMTNMVNIGILDICGFENLDNNNFEQLCINLVNEQLQNFMNKMVIEDERQLYLSEGVEISDVDIEGINNDAILNMFMEPKTGVLAIIDEDSKLEFSNDSQLVVKLTQRYGNNGIFIPPAAEMPAFSIRHFAGEVPYDATSFIKKNRDTLSDDMMECLKSSRSTLIQDLFTAQETHTGSISASNFHFRGSKRPTQGFRRQISGNTNLSQSINESRRATNVNRFGGGRPNLRTVDLAQRNTHIKFFKNSMKDLLEAMKRATPYFVRCIKPNDQQISGQFIRERVKMQLRYNGVKEVARIRTFAYPIRLLKAEFEKTYKDLVPQAGNQDLCYSVFTAVHANAPDFKIGKTQVFMKEPAQRAVEDALTELRRKQEEERREKLRQEEERRKRLLEEKLRKEEEEERAKIHKERTKQLKRELGFGLETIESESSSRREGSIYNELVAGASSRDASGQSAPQEEEESSEEESSEPEEEEEEVPQAEKLSAVWDVFPEMTEEEERPDVHEQPVLMVLKFFVYIILFIVLLGALVCQKVGLLLLLRDLGLESNGKKERDVRSVAFVFLVIAMCLPYVLGWVITVGKLCFGNFKRPSVWTCIWTFIMESLHSTGLCLLVFRVLPKLDVYRAAMLLSATAILPSILKLVMSSSDFEVRAHSWVQCNKTGMLRSVLRGICDALAMFGQLSVIPFVILMDFFQNGDPGYKFTDDHWRIVELIAAFFLSSFSHWENFFDGRLFCELSEKNWFRNACLKIRFEMQVGRHFIHVLTYLVKIGITVGMGYLLSGDAGERYNEAFRTLSSLSEFKLVSPIFTITIAGFVAFYVSFCACMFQMQIISLTIPVVLATPAVILFFYLDCEYEFLGAVTIPHTSTDFCETSLVSKESYYHALFGVCWWITLLILTRHMWQPQVDRTANMARIFVSSTYCGILTAESIMLNRRRNPSRVTRDLKMDSYGDIEAKYYKLLGGKAVIKNEDDEDSAEEDEDGTVDPHDTMEKAASNKKEKHPTTPMLYACATMWHETRTEMVQLLKSLHRLDRDQYIRRLANDKIQGFDPEFYNFEAHIFFDDAMELDDNNERVPNRWVKELVASMDVACSSVHGKPMKVHPPTKVPTPYGGQLIWQMPGENLLFVHLKDMSKIRNRKRWSQVMYMYYLLGYRHIMMSKNEVLEKMQIINARRGHHGLNITEINYLLGEAQSARSMNTFLLALDGDTDFSPGSIKILLDRMKDENVGAACGRIHPIGNGPMIWYQKFEYAIGHWLQKAAEHVFGCVLCSPGCFSLFRAAALMDTNVMKKYTTEPTEPGHHLQYDQGEDRWLCTLMLQQGYRIEYAAAADAWTFAPEGFFEFFNQRRRWMPSTIANILDLLGSATLTTKKNANMSYLYIAYQWLLMLMTILGPGTILMMIAGAVKLVFRISLIEAYLFATVPAAIFTLMCFWVKSRYQLIVAAILSVLYTFIMMIVLVGTIYTATTENIFHPSVIVIVMLMSIFIVSGFCHPKEIWCLVHGIMYLLTIPSGYLLLVIYSIVNLNDVSWGTREVPTKAQRLEMEKRKKEKEEAKKNKEKKGFLARIFNRGEEHIRELTNLVKTLIPERQGGAAAQPANNQQVFPYMPMAATLPQDGRVVQLLSNIENRLGQLLEKSGEKVSNLTSVVVDQPEGNRPEQAQPKVFFEPEPQQDQPEAQPSARATAATAPAVSFASNVQTIAAAASDLKPRLVEEMPPSAMKKKGKKPKIRNELRNPLWAEDKGLGKGDRIVGNPREIEFWKEFVTKYLLPIYPTAEEKKKTADGLRDLRNSASFGMIIINLLWMALNFMFQYTNAARFTITYSYDDKKQEIEESILGLSFVALLLLLLLIQMFGMFIHRMGTLQHLLAITEIRLGKAKKHKGTNEKRAREDAIRHIKEVLRLPATEDPGASTKPPVVAAKNNPFGETVRPTSTRNSKGVSGVLFGDQIGKTIGKLGPLFDAQRSNPRDPTTKKTLDSVRQRLTSGNARQKLVGFEDDSELALSFRPLLPRRSNSKKHRPGGIQLLPASVWGFTHKELDGAHIDVAPSEESLPNLEGMGAMGRTLFQRTKIINDATETMDNVRDLWHGSNRTTRDSSRRKNHRSPNFVRL